jgi:hypothetical protein
MPYPTSQPATTTLTTTLQPGSFVQLSSRQGVTFQVISVDDDTDSCWVRRWPLTRHGSPAFSVGLREVHPLQPQAH